MEDEEKRARSGRKRVNLLYFVPDFLKVITEGVKLLPPRDFRRVCWTGKTAGGNLKIGEVNFLDMSNRGGGEVI